MTSLGRAMLRCTLGHRRRVERRLEELLDVVLSAERVRPIASTINGTAIAGGASCRWP